MKIKEDFILRDMSNGSGEPFYIVIGVGKNAEILKGYLTLNESGAFIYKTLEKGVNSVDEIVDAMLKEYDAPKDVVVKDVNDMVEILRNAGVINEWFAN